MVTGHHGNHFMMHKNIKSLCCTPETNIIFKSILLQLKNRMKSLTALITRHKNLKVPPAKWTT